MAGQSFASKPHADEPLARLANTPLACPSRVEDSELLAGPPRPGVDEPIVSASQLGVPKAEPSASVPKLNEVFELVPSPTAGCSDTGGCSQNTAE
jgi:hypothetical protein